MLDRTIFSTSDTEAVGRIRALPVDSYYLQANGRVVDSVDELADNQLFQLHFRVCGGKGGFGSLLRSFRMHRSQNQLMCRDLSGRRLSDVKEEERLRKWIEKTDEREKEQDRKKQEKYERLKNKGPKHKFEDQDYLRKRDVILDETEDAIEAGVSALKEKSDTVEPEKQPTPQSESSSESDSDVDLDSLFPSTSKRARKRKSPTTEELPAKLPKPEQTVVEAKQVLPSQQYSEEKDGHAYANAIEIATDDSSVTKVQSVVAGEREKSQGESKKTEKTVEIRDFPELDLGQYHSSAELEALGLDHLKHALEARGLKCGGSLQERASRLFSVKGLKSDQYPKKIRANLAKK